MKRAQVRSLLTDLMAWHINAMDAVSRLRELRERVIILTGRDDLADIDIHDISLRTRLLDAVQEFVDPPANS